MRSRRTKAQSCSSIKQRSAKIIKTMLSAQALLDMTRNKDKEHAHASGDGRARQRPGEPAERDDGATGRRRGAAAGGADLASTPRSKSCSRRTKAQSCIISEKQLFLVIRMSILLSKVIDN